MGEAYCRTGKPGGVGLYQSVLVEVWLYRRELGLVMCLVLSRRKRKSAGNAYK